MKIVQVFNETKEIILLERAGLADTFFLRLRGLLAKKELAQGEGLIIKPCNAVHTLGMKFSIDVAFVDKNYRICHTIHGMTPNKVGQKVAEACFVIEGRTGLFSATGTDVGDLVRIKKHKTE